MNKLDLQYQNLLKDILENGTTKQDRTGTGTISVFGRQLRHDFRDGFPLLTTKRMPFKTIVTELLWFLRGDTNIKFLVDNDCHIWDGDAYKKFTKTYESIDGEIILPPDNYINDDGELLSKEQFINKIKTDDEFAKKWGELGPIYGKQWRSWTKKKMYLSTDGSYENIYDEADQTVIDQIAILINELKTNPNSRRMVVSAWAVHDLPNMVLPPCHYGFQVYTRELSVDERLDLASKKYKVFDPFDFYVGDHKEIDELYPVPKRAISLMWNQRSCDFPLGIPANIMSYAILLMMLAKQVNMIPEELIGNFGDCHIYLNQIDGVKEQVTREPYSLPSVKLSDKVVNDLSEYTYQDIILENYQSHPKIYIPLSN
jgi:thymidylate synthase